MQNGNVSSRTSNEDFLMAIREKKLHPGLKHAGYSATTVLPGEDRGAFEKLHRDLIAEFTPAGALEQDIVVTIAHLMWRKQNLSTFSIAEFARKRVEAITCSKLPRPQIAFHDPTRIDPADRAAAEEAATEQAQEELGQTYRLVEIGEAATIDGLMRELDVRERLDVNIDRCIKRLLQVRGVKSISQESSGAAPRQLPPPKRVA